MAVKLHFPAIVHPVQGIRLASVAAGLKRDGVLDLVLIACPEDTQGAAVFTQNAFCAAPVLQARAHLAQCEPRYLLINAGNANAGTGSAGRADALACCQHVATRLGVPVAAVLPFSTGVIGQALPMAKLAYGIDALCNALQCDPQEGEQGSDAQAADWEAAARGIMTTDTQPKCFSERLCIAGRTVTITGICKGSGMIRPDMATMLAFIATDARVEPDSLRALLRSANERSFNSISIDGDTSTNDACVLLASGRAMPADGDALGPQHPDWPAFADAIERCCLALAQAIVRDGEGASKFIELHVRGGGDVAECRQVAYTIAHSPLVKTAFFASDANLGRLLAAIGRSGLLDLAIERVSIAVGGVAIVVNGEPAQDYTEARGQAAMQCEEISVAVDLGRGEAQWKVWTSDLSYDYVRINAEYRT